MSSTPEDIIASLRAGSADYQGAAARENTVWGDRATDARVKQVREIERQAALKLKPGRGRRALPVLARKKGWTFEHGLSLACGGGRAERELMEQGLCRSFVGIDIAEQAIASARTEAEAAGLAIEYRVGDLNTCDLGEGLYDLVVTQNCLHHVVELEFLAAQIDRCLKPGGRVWIDDFIGETQFQWLDRRLEIANQIMAILPERYRRFHLQDKVFEQIERRPPGALVSPFEAIRSGEIMPVFEKHFDVELRFERDTVMHLVAPGGTRSNYAEGEDSAAIFELLLLIDRLLLETGALPPLAGQYVLRKRG